jgi:hypothetical protein
LIKKFAAKFNRSNIKQKILLHGSIRIQYNQKWSKRLLLHITEVFHQLVDVFAGNKNDIFFFFKKNLKKSKLKRNYKDAVTAY